MAHKKPFWLQVDYSSDKKPLPSLLLNVAAGFAFTHHIPERNYTYKTEIENSLSLMGVIACDDTEEKGLLYVHLAPLDFFFALIHHLGGALSPPFHNTSHLEEDRSLEGLVCQSLALLKCRSGKLFMENKDHSPLHLRALSKKALSSIPKKSLACNVTGVSTNHKNI